MWTASPTQPGSNGSGIRGDPSTPVTAGSDHLSLFARHRPKTGVGLDRPNQIATDAYTTAWGNSIPLFLNPTAFAQNATGTFGNVGRNSVFSPGTFEFDAARSRIFAFTERYRLEVRAEGFNVINHTNFAAPNSALNSSNFGRITAIQNSGPGQQGLYRILQFAMKLYF